MRIVTLNANGIRSAGRKGMFDWVKKQEADVVCLQETKARAIRSPTRCITRRAITATTTTPRRRATAASRSMRSASRIAWSSATGRGSSIAKAAISRRSSARSRSCRCICRRAPRARSASARSSASSRSSCRTCEALKRKRRDYILCGDWNIAHKEIDLRNWRSNQKNSGFLPRGARLARRAVRGRRLRRRLPRDQQRARSVHLVVESRPGVGEERRLAHRLSGPQPGSARQRAARGHLQEAALLRSRAARDGLRPQAAMSTNPVATSRIGWRAYVPAAVRPYTEPAPLAALFLGVSSGAPYALHRCDADHATCAGRNQQARGHCIHAGVSRLQPQMAVGMGRRWRAAAGLRRLGQRVSWLLLTGVLAMAAIVNLALVDPKASLTATARGGDPRRARWRDLRHRDRCLSHRIAASRGSSASVPACRSTVGESARCPRARWRS